MFKARRLKSGNYNVQYVEKDEFGHPKFDENGKRVVKSFTAPTELEAIKMACNYANVSLSSCVELNMTVSQGIDEYIEIKSAPPAEGNNGRKKTVGLSPTTIRGYRAIQNTRLQSIMNIPMSKLTLKDVQRAVTIDSQRLSGKSIKEALSLVKTVLSWNDISMNMKKITYTKESKVKEELPTAKKIYAAITGTPIELPCLLASWRSLRMSEVRGLKFSDISPDGKYITIQRVKIYQDGKDIVKNETKTNDSTRKIPLPKELYERIMAIPHQSDDEFIFSFGYKYIYYNFKQLMKKNGMPDMTFHKLRHEFATICSDLEIPEIYTEKIGGWSSSKILKEVYTHTSSDKEAEYTETIDDFYREIISDTTGEPDNAHNEKHSKAVVAVKVKKPSRGTKAVKTVKAVKARCVRISA